VRIIKATDSIPVDHPVFMIFGQPGIGKSSLAYSCKDVLALDFDKGAHRAANRRDTLVIDSWKDVEELMATPDGLDGYHALAVDTVGRCLDVLTAHLARQDPKKFPGGVPGLQGWGALKNHFRQWIAALRGLGKDVLLVAHDKEDKDGDTRIVRPDIVGGSYAEVMKVADFVGYLQMSGKDRVLDFNPTDRWIGKNPAGWAPFRLPPAAKSTEFLADLFAKGRAALGALSDESAALMRQVETWRETIAGYTTAAQYSAAVPLVSAIDVPVVQAQVRKVLWDAAQAKGLTFDKTAKTFTEPAAEPVGA
jgi:hypothetical protein